MLAPFSIDFTILLIDINLLWIALSITYYVLFFVKIEHNFFPFLTMHIVMGEIDVGMACHLLS